MTIRTRIHGYTAWINMRLMPFDQTLSNVVMDLLRGTNMKYLIQSYTGQKNEKFQSFENMSKDQLQTRIKWALKELKLHHVIADDIQLDTRSFAVRSAKHVFELLWRLVCHDIFFLYERIDFLSNTNEDELIQVPFTWVPIPPIEKKKSDPEISALSGFTALLVQDAENEPEEDDNFIDDVKRFPGSDIMKSFSLRNIQVKQTPDPKTCIIEMINVQLKKVPEGKKIMFTKLNELSDTRVLCGLINSFVPNLFPTEILMNDRWCINLVLRSIDKMLMCNSTMDSEDLAEAEPQSICSFFCYLFMMFYKFRQCKAVVNKYKTLEISIRKLQKDLDVGILEKDSKYNIENKLAQHKLELDNLKNKYDIKYYVKWVDKVQLVKESVHAVINNKFKLKFDWFPLEEDITVANLCFNQAINLTLTSGVGFYKLTNKEAISRDRQIILRQKNNQFIYDENSNTAHILRRILKVPNFDPVEIDPKLYPQYDIFVECLSNNKILKKGTVFMYQVFPTNIKFYHNFLMKACLEKDLDAVKRLIEFFSVYYPNFIDLKEQGSLNSALHICASNGYFKILLYLLESYANVNIQNREGNTPLVLASESFHRDCTKLLLEFGADVNIKNSRGNTILNHPIAPDYKTFIEANIRRLSDILPGIMKGDYHTMDQVITEHLSGLFPLCTLRSRFINGSTLLHTCSYYGHYDLVEKLLKTTDIDLNPLNPNMRDYKGATPLHRAKDLRIIKLLLDYGADVNSTDLDGNIPLHVKCYGEKRSPSELEAIEMLIYYKADLTAKNKKKLLPIHMAAMQGRLDILKLIVEKDTENTIPFILNRDQNQIPSSPAYLALANDHIECADWLIKNSFMMRNGEPNTLMYKILTEQIIVKQTGEMLMFLCQNGCDLNAKFVGGNTALHYAAGLTSDPDNAIKILIAHGAYVNAINDTMQTPLFCSVQANNPLAASTLLEFNADFKMKNSEGHTAFDLIKDIDEWVQSDFFETNIKVILKTFEYKQTRCLIRAISEKMNSDFSSKAMLNRRNKTISSYINQHYQMLNATRAIPAITSPSPRIRNQITASLK